MYPTGRVIDVGLELATGITKYSDDLGSAKRELNRSLTLCLG